MESKSIFEDVGSIGSTAVLKCGDDSYNAQQISIMVKQLSDLIKGYTNPVGIILSRNKYLIPAMFSCIKLNRPFLLIDSHLPSDRIAHMLNNSSCGCILTETNMLLPLLYEEVCVHDGIKLQVANCKEQGKNEPNNENILYHQYTSGSTGVPKGIEITREAVNNFVNGIVDVIPFQSDDVVSGLSPISFDVFLLESIIALHLGLTVCLCTDNILENPRKIIKWIKSNKISIMQSTPSRLRQLYYLDTHFNFLENVKKILVGGEEFPYSLLEKLHKHTNCEIYNLYGPAETTIWSSVADLTKACQVHIGKPIHNTKFRIMSSNMEELLEGEQGEICISGAGLARRYINNNELTEQKFVYLKNGDRLYRTGDFGKKIDKDTYICLGRMDNQVKIRGNRVELEEIEHNANLYPLIVDSVAFVEKKKEEDILILVYVSIEQEDLEVNKFAKFILDNLPKYMLPNKYIRVNEIPLNVNGKKDRKKIKELYGGFCDE